MLSAMARISSRLERSDKEAGKIKRRPKGRLLEKTVGTRERERSLPANPSFLWSQ
jgi:hypothetical protein